ncbi:MAG: PhzF family phenazine biosynthesis protein [Arhodomonas sp.]|nr:PhzF family phenazine biosynthesis protein [Arhodomonas sp.]
MQALPIIQVDAYTASAFGGVPCGVILDADDLDDEVMQRLAGEFGTEETVFVTDSEVADFQARCFTAYEEIPLTGHPAIAVVHGLLVKGRLGPRQDVRRLCLDTVVGLLEMDLSGAGDEPPLISVTHRAPDFYEEQDPAEVAVAFHLETEDLRPGAPVQTVDTGTPHLMVPVADAEALHRARLDPERFSALRRFGGFVGAHLFVLEGASEGGDVFSRHFGARLHHPERPFTGSATGAMGSYLWRHGLIGQCRFVAEQGHWLGRPGQADVEVLGDADDIRGVRVAGHAVQVMEGLVLVP